MDPITLMMFALIAVMIFFMFRNSKKRQRTMQELQNNMRPGAEVMLQSGIYGTLEDIDEETNRATIRSGTTTLVVHRNAISQVVTPVEGADAQAETGSLAPDDDPAFGEHIADTKSDADQSADAGDDSNEKPGDEPGEETNPKA
ncbi:preprotein translocase subunit YajC [Leucobacter sp. HY1910]